MKKAVLLLVLLCSAVATALCQNLKISPTKATFSYKADGVDYYQVSFKVVSGTLESGKKAEFAIIQNGQIKGYAVIYDAGATLRTGETTKYDVTISVVSKTPLAAGLTLVSFDLAPTNLPANRAFSFKSLFGN